MKHNTCFVLSGGDERNVTDSELAHVHTACLDDKWSVNKSMWSAVQLYTIFFLGHRLRLKVHVKMHRSPRAITSATTEVSGASDILSSLHVRVGDSWRQDCLTCAQHHSSFFNYRKKKEANIALRPQRERFLLLVDWIFWSRHGVGGR